MPHIEERNMEFYEGEGQTMMTMTITMTIFNLTIIYKFIQQIYNSLLTRIYNNICWLGWSRGNGG